MFPVPRITESFVDEVAYRLGWARYEDIKSPEQGHLNADYVLPNAVIELKILEEEGLEKKSRQDKVAKIYESLKEESKSVDISFENIPHAIRRNLESVIAQPIQTAVKKASKQIRETIEDLSIEGIGVLIIINNGYSYLDANDFEKLVITRCKNDTSNIQYAICITVEHHKGDFDTYVFCTIRCHNIRQNNEWSEAEKFREAFQGAFTSAMGEMIGDQLSPDLWNNKLLPVTDILFERNKIRYIRKAPYVPNSWDRK